MPNPLRQYRQKHHMSQEEMAARITNAGVLFFGEDYSCEQAHVSRWERGKTLPAPHHLLALLVACGGRVTRCIGRLSLEEIVRAVPLKFSSRRK